MSPRASIFSLVILLAVTCCQSASAESTKRAAAPMKWASSQQRAVALVERAKRLREKGETKEAILLLNKAITIAPTYSLAYFQRAPNRSWEGDRKGSIKDNTEVIRLDPKLAAHASPGTISEIKKLP